MSGHLLEVTPSLNNSEHLTGHALTLLQYSKSSRAKCNGPAPCNGTAIEKGTLRYGEATASPYGESVKWRHW
jgi:hypothetical protein